jgi:ATP-dependent DNA helicase PIF1
LKYPIEFLNDFQSLTLPQHKLILKNNTVIMLTRNINIQKGLCNGTKYEMTNLKPHVIEAKIFTEKNVEIFIPRIKF